MNDQALLVEIRAILKNQCEVEIEVFKESVIQEDLELDSIGLLTLIAAVEETYDLKLDDLDEPPVTIADLIQIILKHRS